MTEQESRSSSTQPFRPVSSGDSDLRGPLLIGCGSGCSVLLVLALVLASVLAFRMEELATLGRAMPEAAITAGAPADWSEGEAAALSLAFQAAFQAIDEGRADFDTSLDMYREIMDAASKAPQGLLTRDDLLRLTRALEAVAGVSRSDTAPGDIATLSAGDASCLISS